MISKVKTLAQTLSYLKPVQAFYQVKNRLFKVSPLSSYAMDYVSTQKLQFFRAPAIHRFLNIESNQFHFQFLNLSRSFSNAIDWNDQSHGKLWNYNLQYLDFLKQEDVSTEIKVSLIKDIYTWLWEGKLPLEPYPSSLRIMNMIRFLETSEISDEEKRLLNRYVLAEVNYLSQNLEYHLLGNHLLENAFAWWMASNYFKKEEWISRAGKLLRIQLDEQILKDGAHFELAPMYHQIILFRVLEAFYLTPSEYDLKLILKDNAANMLGWINAMTLPDGKLPHFNDTTEGIAYSSNTLSEFGNSLGLFHQKIRLNDSGYRTFQSSSLKLITDIEGIKPTYQPGHAHADTFSFILHHDNNPIIVDPGISTYNIGPRRAWERSTLAHNTVTIDGKNSSQVWAGFRVGKRANVKILKDEPGMLSASHDGFGKQNHHRTFRVNDLGIEILDRIAGLVSRSLGEGRYYLHPDIAPKILSDNKIFLTEELTLEVQGAKQIEIHDYQFCLGYNNLRPAKFILVTFNGDTLNSFFAVQS